MTDSMLPPETTSDETSDLQSRAAILEKRLAEVQEQSNARLIRAEAKAEALRAGIVDLEGLKLLDLSSAKVGDNGEVEGVGQLVVQFKKLKPYLFAGLPASSSNSTAAPPAQPARQKLATEMTDAEYRAARAALLKRRS